MKPQRLLVTLFLCVIWTYSGSHFPLYAIDTPGADSPSPLEEKKAVKSEDFILKAGLLKTFARYCEWPAGHKSASDTNHNNEFILGSFEEDKMTSYLMKKSETITIGGKELKVQIIEDYAEIKKCDILYIQETSKKKLNEILETVDDLPILTVSEGEGYAKKGIMINLFKSGVKYRFNVNYNRVQKCGLRLSSKLLKYAAELL